MADTVTRFKPPGLVSGLSLGPPKTHLTAARQAAARLSEKRRRNARPPYAEPPEPMAFPWAPEWSASTVLTTSTSGFEFSRLEQYEVEEAGPATEAAISAAPPAQTDSNATLTGPVLKDVQAGLADGAVTFIEEESWAEVEFEEEQREPEYIPPPMYDFLADEPRTAATSQPTRPAAASEPIPASALRIQLPMMATAPLRPKIVLAPKPQPEAPSPAQDLARIEPHPEPAVTEKPARGKASRARSESGRAPAAEQTESLEKLASAVTRPEPAEIAPPKAERAPEQSIEALREQLTADARPAPVEGTPATPPVASPIVARVEPVPVKKTEEPPAAKATPAAVPEPKPEKAAKVETVKAEPAEVKRAEEPAQQKEPRERERRGRAKAVEAVTPPAPSATIPIERVPTFGMPQQRVEEEPAPAKPELFNVEQAASAGGMPMGAKIGIGAVLAVVLGGVGVWKMGGGSSTASSKPVSGAAVNAVEVAGMVTGEGGWSTDWGLDARGIKKVRQFSFFRPSMQLTDYRVEFQGEIEYKAMGWVFRASDIRNYYFMKLQIVKPGASPTVHLVRYAVVDGQESERAEKPLTMRLALDTVYRVRLDIQGSKFTTYVQGQPVDEWTENRITKGGFGIANDTGERGQIRAVQMWHLRPRVGQ